MPDALPAYASTLQSIYGEPSSGAWGSAVFHAAMPSGASLEDAAFATYRTFVGPAWERFGAEAWTGGWQRVHERPAAGPRDLIAELKAQGVPYEERMEAIEELSWPKPLQHWIRRFWMPDRPQRSIIPIFTRRASAGRLSM